MPSPTQLDPSQLSELIRQAEEVAHHAYAPYSNFFVGAALLLESGEVVTGCNVENASYRLTSCAEQAAIARAVAQHGPTIRIRAVIVANLAKVPCQPCGACRQTILEFAKPDTLIGYPAADGQLTFCTMAELLPAAFTLESATTSKPAQG